MSSSPVLIRFYHSSIPRLFGRMLISVGAEIISRVSSMQSRFSSSRPEFLLFVDKFPLRVLYVEESKDLFPIANSTGTILFAIKRAVLIGS